jgi:hypothetical protein
LGFFFGFVSSFTFLFLSIYFYLFIFEGAVAVVVAAVVGAAAVAVVVAVLVVVVVVFTFLAHLSTKCSRVSFCHHSASVVRPSKKGVKLFKQHLLLNHMVNCNQTLQKWSLGGPLLKLFKNLNSI